MPIIKDQKQLELEVTMRARSIWLRRDQPSGQDLVIWLEAEKEIISSYWQKARRSVCNRRKWRWWSNFCKNLWEEFLYYCV